MSTFLHLARRQAARPPTTPFYSRAQPVARPFSSAQRMRIKEDKPQDPQELEKTKQEQIEKQKKGEGHWHEELASSSESHIAADRQDVGDHEEHMEDLQKETAGQQEKSHPQGKAEH